MVFPIFTLLTGGFVTFLTDSDFILGVLIIWDFGPQVLWALNLLFPPGLEILCRRHGVWLLVTSTLSWNLEIWNSGNTKKSNSKFQN